jgi:hypothetical protein
VYGQSGFIFQQWTLLCRGRQIGRYVGSNFTSPFEYDPVANAWTTKAATFPDDNVNNMACGVLTVGGTPQIYCVGGSPGGGTTATARVFSYDPLTDTITALTAADDWPGNPPSPETFCRRLCCPKQQAIIP